MLLSLPLSSALESTQVIPLVPEFIVPQDGHDKQDCENAAALAVAPAVWSAV